MRIPSGQLKKLNELAMKRTHLRTTIAVYKNQTKQQIKNSLEETNI